MRLKKNLFFTHLIFLVLITEFLAVIACADSSLNHQEVQQGIWGGKHIQLIVKEKGASVEYDCAFGSIDGPLLRDEKGYFEARGVHMFESGGPGRPGAPKPKKHSALYQGWINGDQMRLTVTLPDSERQIGTFSLVLGIKPMLEKCL